jgi:hypothetical protein
VLGALFGTGSGGAEGAAGGISDSTVVREFGCSSTGPAALGGLAAAGFVAIATLLAFIAGLNGDRFGAIGVVAAVLVKQPCEVHVCTTPRGGKGQQPIKAAHRAPMRNGLINCFRAGKIPFPAFPEGDNEAMKIND